MKIVQEVTEEYRSDRFKECVQELTKRINRVKNLKSVINVQYIQTDKTSNYCYFRGVALMEVFEEKKDTNEYKQSLSIE